VELPDGDHLIRVKELNDAGYGRLRPRLMVGPSGTDAGSYRNEQQRRCRHDDPEVGQGLFILRMSLVRGRSTPILVRLSYAAQGIVSGQSVGPKPSHDQRLHPRTTLPCSARHPEVTFADRVKAHRRAAGLTATGLARVGVPHQQVCD
jgi:hypothetical protein